MLCEEYGVKHSAQSAKDYINVLPAEQKTTRIDLRSTTAAQGIFLRPVRLQSNWAAINPILNVSMHVPRSIRISAVIRKTKKVTHAKGDYFSVIRSTRQNSNVPSTPQSVRMRNPSLRPLRRRSAMRITVRMPVSEPVAVA